MSLINFGTFRLDGGAMFGSVPKVVWNKRCRCDRQNRISLATNSLLIEGHNRKILIDCGVGGHWDDRFCQRFAVKSRRPTFDPSTVTDVILTHLHFDHSGGSITIGQNQQPSLVYSQAKYHLQRANWLIANAPSVRERASYYKTIIDLIAPHCSLIDGEGEIFPGIKVYRSDGHTRGLQWITVERNKDTIAFPSDLIPTRHHVQLPFVMGYDMQVETILDEKRRFLDLAADHGWKVILQHELHQPVVTIGSSGTENYSALACTI